MSQETQFNPVIKAVQSLRKLVLEINDDNKEIRTNEKIISQNIENAGKMIISLNEDAVTKIWLSEKLKLENNINELLEFIKSIETKFKNKDTSNITELFRDKDQNRDAVIIGLAEMQKIGEVVFTGSNLEEWNKTWQNISNAHDKILSFREVYGLKLKMIENLTPEEIDSLTKDILKHIPINYTDEEAQKYEQEYTKAFNEIKEEQSK